jgi:hypothetical protein
VTAWLRMAARKGFPRMLAQVLRTDGQDRAAILYHQSLFTVRPRNRERQWCMECCNSWLSTTRTYVQKHIRIHAHTRAPPRRTSTHTHTHTVIPSSIHIRLYITRMCEWEFLKQSWGRVSTSILSVQISFHKHSVCEFCPSVNMYIDVTRKCF